VNSSFILDTSWGSHFLMWMFWMLVYKATNIRCIMFSQTQEFSKLSLTASPSPGWCGCRRPAPAVENPTLNEKNRKIWESGNFHVKIMVGMVIVIFFSGICACRWNFFQNRACTMYFGQALQPLRNRTAHHHGHLKICTEFRTQQDHVV